MEAQTDIQTYLEQGRQALAQGQAREAAIAYAHGAQMEPDNPLVHLGLAQANLALGNYDVVKMACRRVQELQPTGGAEGFTAQALLDLLDRRYDRALQNIDTVISENPGVAYAHALRSYLLRATGQDYDANLARARAARLSFGGRFEGCFPPLESSPYGAYKGNPTPAIPTPTVTREEPRPAAQEPVPTWSRPNQVQRQVVRTRFALSQRPGLVTNVLITINVVVYLVMAILSKSITDLPQDIIVQFGAQNTPLIQQTGQYWRIFTAMFIHFNLIHIGLNMLSLFLIGRVVELFYGKWRYLVIYLGSGILGGIATFFLDPNVLAAGASGAIFGVFGALGVFYIVNRRALGAYGPSAIGQWVFWLGLNLIWGFSTPGIGVLDHIGGLVAGILLAILLMPRTRGRRAF
ncbi:MAG: rhomboid family intramembrane serine protease [Chloroflexota bacterium]|nr:rhomboid family intramembrane serine protease [Chloroflexota bacterium]